MTLDRASEAAQAATGTRDSAPAIAAAGCAGPAQASPRDFALLQALTLPACVLDTRLLIVAANSAWDAFAGGSGSEVGWRGHSYLDACTRAGFHFVAHDAQDAFRAFADGGDERLRLTLRHVNGDGSSWYDVDATHIGTGDAAHIMVLQRDVTAEHRLADARASAAARDTSHLERVDESEAQHGNFDALTGLPKRGLLYDRLQQALQRAQHAHDVVSVFHIDLDQFHLINESFGQKIGDAVLHEAACRLQEAIGTSETVARAAGDEFVAFLVGSERTTDNAPAVNARCIMDAFHTAVVIDGHEIFLNCSIGVAVYPRDGKNAAALMRCAGAALDEAKRGGRNVIRFYTAESDNRARELLALESALRRAIERRELHLLYQPQVDLGTGEIIGVEALLRWKHATLGLVPTDRLIALAEQSGLIVEIGAWVLRTACAQAVAWQRQGLPPLRIGVNVSALQLRAPDFPALVREVLEESGLTPAQLQLEVTESMLMQDADASIAALRRLRDLGVETALDDFGTGYSSLSYLKRFPLDVVKIDKAFVQDVTAAPEDTSISRAIVTMAHALGLKSVAEGVETEGQLALLLAHGCDRFQGYYFSPPITGDAFVELRGRKLNIDALRMSGRKRKLLVVDDEPNILSSIRRLLRREGYEILTATSAASGLELLAKADVDVIMSDQRMPGMTGVEFLRRAKQLRPDTVRIVLSGFTELSSITDAINEGAIYKFLAKPWDDDTLRQHVVEAFRQKEQDDEQRKLSSQARSANRELAELNVELQKTLERQRLMILHGATTLDMARCVIDGMTNPVIGVGPEGSVMLSNLSAARELHLPLGSNDAFAADVLPASLLELLATPDRSVRPIQLHGQRYAAMHRKVLGAEHAAGSLLILTRMES